MHRIRHPSRRSSHLSLWLGLLAAVGVLAGFVHYSSIQAEKKKAGNYNYLQAVPSDPVLKSKLTEDQYRVARQNGTETAFRNEYWDNNRPGIYVDVITNDPLFSSLDKFDSGTGRPTFTKPISPDSVFQQADSSHDMQRTEVRAKLSNSHLGHVFKDATSPTDERYAVNSASLRFVATDKMESEGYAEYLRPFEKKE
ncbi:MAG TPA: peptide-methionine (R)-S-oxide reductase MsrB [Chthoniobacterales bacterium]|jgi:methionine-R-sulfoxide reductase|nr:peptide-methionine (R)-S-oxide reductase MsrB [Chthoniobacterales bacterium]